MVYQKWVLRMGGVIAAFIVLLAWSMITPLVIIITAAVLFVYLVAIELVRGGPAEEAPPQQSEAEDTEKPRDDR